MKTVEEIFTYERLYKSFCDCKAGHMWKSSVIAFEMGYVGRLLKLEEEIQKYVNYAGYDRIKTLIKYCKNTILNKIKNNNYQNHFP